MENNVNKIGLYEVLFDAAEEKDFLDKIVFEKINDVLCYANSKILNKYFEKSSIELASSYFDAINHIMDYFNGFGFVTYKNNNYPSRLSDLKEKIFLLYYLGNFDLINSHSISIIGSRKSSQDGLKRASKLTKCLVQNGFTIVSGLAEGIDTAAHKACLEENGKTIAVIGTPLNHCYPINNKSLMQEIAKNHLVISQVPFIRYERLGINLKKLFFPERNKTMSAISDATVIVEATDKSGTLIQARAALDQGRRLFILQNNFDNKNVTWPEKFERLGAIRVRNMNDILDKFSC